jgi:hypothetical protein
MPEVADWVFAGDRPLGNRLSPRRGDAAVLEAYGDPLRYDIVESAVGTFLGAVTTERGGAGAGSWGNCRRTAFLAGDPSKQRCTRTGSNRTVRVARLLTVR